MSRCLLSIIPLTSNVNFHSSCSHNADHIIWVAPCGHHGCTTWTSTSAFIVLHQRSHCGHMHARTSTETAIENETRPKKYLVSLKRYQSKLLCGCDNNLQSSLNPPRSESHSPRSVRRYWGQPAQRMKQMKSFRWDARNPVLTTVVRPPRRLHPGRGSLSRLFGINEGRRWHAQSLNCPPPVISRSTKTTRSCASIRRRGERICAPLFSRFPLMPVALWTH